MIKVHNIYTNFRVLVAVIEAFHFDLQRCIIPKSLMTQQKSKSTEDIENVPELSDDQKILQTTNKVVLPQLRECIRPNVFILKLVHTKISLFSFTLPIVKLNRMKSISKKMKKLRGLQLHWPPRNYFRNYLNGY